MTYFEPFWSLIVHFILSSLICLLIVFVLLFLGKRLPDSQKNMTYECGFQPFGFEYIPFDVQFYRYGILFLLFDVEIMFLFPLVLNFYQVSLIGHYSVILFLVLLFLGFLYEIKSGALVWYPQPRYNVKKLQYNGRAQIID